MVYKLYYFSIRGVAEPIRQLFKVAEKDFEDITFDKPEFMEKYKKEMPFGQVPVLELENGEKIPQSGAIARFLANEFGLSGKTPVEQAWVDAIVDQYKDFYVEIKPFYYCALGVIEGDVEERYKEVFLPAAQKFFTFLTTIYKKTGSGFLVGDSVTYADLLICDHLVTIHNVHPEFIDSWPEMKALKEKVYGLPQLKAWLETRPSYTF